MTRAEWNETLKKCAKDYHSKKGTKPRKKYSKKKKSNKSATIQSPQVTSRPIANLQTNNNNRGPARFPFNLIV